MHQITGNYSILFYISYKGRLLYNVEYCIFVIPMSNNNKSIVCLQAKQNQIPRSYQIKDTALRDVSQYQQHQYT